MTHLIVERCGPGTTLQDQGRFGWQRYGLGPAGAMDRVAMAEANLLVGNEAGVAAIEFALAGGRLRVAGGRVRVALAGADAELKIDGRGIAPNASATADDGALIDIGTARAGLFMYLALAGGFDVPPDLGAVATHVRAGLGGIGGRSLAAGDQLPCVRAEPGGEDLALDASFKRASANGPIRVMLGPQDDYFTDAGRATFLSATYTVTPQADRMGFRLTGPKIEHGPKGYNIVSDGIATGSIQVPGMGEPLILLADRQTTGGYPKIATVITADLGRLAQMRPGAELKFQAVTRAEALAALTQQRAALQAFRAHLRSAASALDLTSERLLSLNLIDGWTSDGG
jgi:5-oxoprolinase (ATP-hydrolysing) subunit C